jgi:hypothetical protein
VRHLYPENPAVASSGYFVPKGDLAIHNIPKPKRSRNSILRFETTGRRGNHRILLDRYVQEDVTRFGDKTFYRYGLAAIQQLMPKP